jgi:hypothetical protein
MTAGVSRLPARLLLVALPFNNDTGIIDDPKSAGSCGDYDQYCWLCYAYSFDMNW